MVVCPSRGPYWFCARPAGFLMGGATTPMETIYLRASSTFMSSSMTSLRLTKKKKPLTGLALIGRIGTAGGTGYAIEFGGAAIRALSMEGRMTVCNMAIEAGARVGVR